MPPARVPGPLGKDGGIQGTSNHNESSGKKVGPFSHHNEHLAHHTGRATPVATGAQTQKGSADSKSAGGESKQQGTKSGKYWVTWADVHAPNSKNIADLAEPFRSKVNAFEKALEEAGADVRVLVTRRPAKRAYLFHWAWKIAHLPGAEKQWCKASEAKPMTGVDIVWDHGDESKSKAGAKEMVDGFGLDVPPKSTNAPALSSRHIDGNAIDMVITWEGTLTIKKKGGAEVTVKKMEELYAVGESYGVMKLRTDANHWSSDGG